MVTLVNTATGGGDVMSAGVAYLRTNLVPKIGANVFFFVLAALFLLIFLLWRFLCWCCLVVCCRSSCDAKRSKRDPFEILFNRRMTVLKALMFLFALVAIVLFIYGMSSTSKTVVQEAFTTVDSLSNYLSGAVGHITDLSSAVGNISLVITDFQLIVTDDVDVAGFRTNIAVVKTFLTTVTPPATLAASLTAFDTNIHTNLDTALTSLGTGLAACGGGSPLSNALTAVGGAMASAAGMTAALNDLDTKATALPAGGGAQ